MIKIDSYLNDGANWQAQCVLAYLRAYIENAFWETADKYSGTQKELFVKEIKDNFIRMSVGRFENCREQGYVFTLHYRKKNGDRMIPEQEHYGVFEHRNTDDIVVFISNTFTINTPNISEIYNGRDKYGYDACFGWGKVVKCGDWIINAIKSTLSKIFEE